MFFLSIKNEIHTTLSRGEFTSLPLLINHTTWVEKTGFVLLALFLASLSLASPITCVRKNKVKFDRFFDRVNSNIVSIFLTHSTLMCDFSSMQYYCTPLSPQATIYFVLPKH